MSGEISNASSAVEQFSYVPFIETADELHTFKEAKSAHARNLFEDPVFGPDEAHLRWWRFKVIVLEKTSMVVRDRALPIMNALGQKDGSGDGEATATLNVNENAVVRLAQRRELPDFKFVVPRRARPEEVQIEKATQTGGVARGR